ncbi:hypothetical protein [Streptomyces globisporus]|uniref:hypothetical protein n=1 Tax=Streptomyces globisporus TaxID=1908 RepID=UPI0037B60C62
MLAPNGQWLTQDRPESPVRLLDGPTAMVELAAEIQHRIRTTRNPPDDEPDDTPHSRAR